MTDLYLEDSDKLQRVARINRIVTELFLQLQDLNRELSELEIEDIEKAIPQILRYQQDCYDISTKYLMICEK